jgi:uncharacterized protein YecE (DUF72 family)
VKLPKEITHGRRLKHAGVEVGRFLAEVAGLGDKLGAILVQLPPSLAFDVVTAAEFFTALRESTPMPIVCEPRHETWFRPAAEGLLSGLHVGRVAADPAVSPEAGFPGGDLSTAYYRWHGSPRIYYSNYELEALRTLASDLRAWSARGSKVWCIFDNTALNAAIGNALSMLELLGPQDCEQPISPSTAT